MFRLYDWECPHCGKVSEHGIDVPSGDSAPRSRRLLCSGSCRDGDGNQLFTTHSRMLPLLAPYTGEKVVNPRVKGGTYDTMGYRALPRLPTLPDGMDGEGARAFIKSKEYREVVRQRKVIGRQNQAKRKRARAMARGEPVNMRRDHCPGDPKGI